MPNQSFDLTGPVGRLEAILMEPEGETRAAAVVCHAHPLHGGMMHFKVIFRVAKALQEQGVAALRFNFRGVGLSAGASSSGAPETESKSQATSPAHTTRAVRATSMTRATPASRSSRRALR